jgi:hypothetical protein
MSKATFTTFTFRVPSKLHTHFIAAALKKNRLPSDVLVEFMRNYVRDARAKKMLEDNAVAGRANETVRGNIVDYAGEAASLLRQRELEEAMALADRFFEREPGPRGIR